MEILFEGIKKFASEIISAVLFTVVVWGYKRSKRFLKQYNRMKQEAERLEGALKESESQRQEEARQKEELKGQLEILQQEHERLKTELAQREEALQQTEDREAECAKLREEIAHLTRQLEAEKQETKRLKVELARRGEEVQKADNGEAECARLREEITRLTRQLEAEKQETERLKGEIAKRDDPMIDARTQYELGKKCQQAERYEGAVNYYRQAAEKGFAVAQYALGLMYEAGTGVKQDDYEAKRWYRRAAKQGNFLAQKKVTELTRRGVIGPLFDFDN